MWGASVFVWREGHRLCGTWSDGCPYGSRFWVELSPHVSPSSHSTQIEPARLRHQCLILLSFFLQGIPSSQPSRHIKRCSPNRGEELCLCAPFVGSLGRVWLGVILRVIFGPRGAPLCCCFLPYPSLGKWAQVYCDDYHPILLCNRRQCVSGVWSASCHIRGQG